MSKKKLVLMFLDKTATIRLEQEIEGKRKSPSSEIPFHLAVLVLKKRKSAARTAFF